MTIYFTGTTVSDFDSYYSVGYGGTAIWIPEDDISPLDSNGNTTIQFYSNYRNAISSSVQKNLDTVVTGPFWTSLLYSGHYYLTDLDDWDLSQDDLRSAFAFFDGEGNTILKVGFNANASPRFQIRVHLRDGTTEDITDIDPTTSGVNDKWDFRIEPGVGFKIWLNRSLIVNYTGNVGNSASSVNGVGKISLGQCDQGWPGDTYISSVLCADFNTLYAEVKQVTLNTTPSTDTSSFSNGDIVSTVDNADFGSYDNPNYKGFDAVGEKVIFPENDTVTLTEGKSIAGVVTSYRAVQTGSSPVTTLTPTLSISSTDYTGTDISVTTTRSVYQHVFATNPATATTWQEADLEGIGYGLTMNA